MRILTVFHVPLVQLLSGSQPHVLLTSGPLDIYKNTPHESVGSLSISDVTLDMNPNVIVEKISSCTFKLITAQSVQMAGGRTLQHPENEFVLDMSSSLQDDQLIPSFVSMLAKEFEIQVFSSQSQDIVPQLDGLVLYKDAPPKYEDVANRFALLDQDSGKIVGVVGDQHLRIVNEEQLQVGSQNSAVIVELNSKKEQPVKPAHSKDMLYTSSEYIASGVKQTASVLGKAIIGGARLAKNVVPVTSKPVQVDPKTQHNIQTAQSVTGQVRSAVSATAAVVGQVGKQAGKVIAQKVKTHTSPPVTDPTRYSHQESSSSWSALRLVSSVVGAAVNVAEAFADGLKSLVEDSKEATSIIIRHRYGDEAGDAAKGVLESIGNVVLVYVDAQGMTHRAFLRKAAKEALVETAGTHRTSSA